MGTQSTWGRTLNKEVKLLWPDIEEQN